MSQHGNRLYPWQAFVSSVSPWTNSLLMWNCSLCAQHFNAVCAIYLPLMRPLVALSQPITLNLEWIKYICKYLFWLRKQVIQTEMHILLSEHSLAHMFCNQTVFGEEECVWFTILVLLGTCWKWKTTKRVTQISCLLHRYKQIHVNINTCIHTNYEENLMELLCVPI